MYSTCWRFQLMFYIVCTVCMGGPTSLSASETLTLLLLFIEAPWLIKLCSPSTYSILNLEERKNKTLQYIHVNYWYYFNHDYLLCYHPLVSHVYKSVLQQRLNVYFNTRVYHNSLISLNVVYILSGFVYPLS